VSKNEVAKPSNSALPDFLKGGKTTTVGNVDSSDLIIPRVKLLQGLSPEIIDGIDGAKVGHFWHTIAGETLGNKLKGVPLLLRKTYVLWAPRDDERGVLARALDGLHWDNAGMEFTVKPKKSPHNVTYKLGKTVHECVGDGPALSEFGSSIPGDPKSPPAASLTYELLWYFPDFEELSPAIILNARSGVKPAQNLISKIDMRPTDHYAQMYEIGVSQEKAADGPFFNYTYTSAGYVEEELFHTTKMLYEKFSKTAWRANEESNDTDIGDAGGKSRGGTMDGDIPF